MICSYGWALVKLLLFCRPQTQGEEELQLQLALAMSREEADAEETKKKSDDMRLTLAIQKSKEEVNCSMFSSRIFDFSFGRKQLRRKRREVL